MTVLRILSIDSFFSSRVVGKVCEVLLLAGEYYLLFCSATHPVKHTRIRLNNSMCLNSFLLIYLNEETRLTSKSTCVSYQYKLCTTVKDMSMQV